KDADEDGKAAHLRFHPAPPAPRPNGRFAFGFIFVHLDDFPRRYQRAGLPRALWTISCSRAQSALSQQRRGIATVSGFATSANKFGVVNQRRNRCQPTTIRSSRSMNVTPLASISNSMGAFPVLRYQAPKPANRVAPSANAKMTAAAINTGAGDRPPSPR